MPKVSRLFRRLLSVFVGLLLGVTLAELSLNAFLLSDAPGWVSASEGLRQPSLWADQKNDTLYWTLDVKWSGPEQRQRTPNCPDDLLGWVKHEITPGTYEHSIAQHIQDRRPVLLYGDSFAHGVTKPPGKFIRLFNQTELGDSHALINYGVGGYGTDQAYLLCKESLPLFEDRNPIVIFSVLVDDNLDRMALEYRCWPKPRLSVDRGLLSIRRPPTTDGDVFLDEESIRPFSWISQFLKNSPTAFGEPPRSRLNKEQRLDDEKRAIFKAMMVDLKADMKAKDIEWFVMIFLGRLAAISPKPHDWRETFVISTLKELEIPYVNTRPDMYALINEHGLLPKDLFILKGHGLNHLNKVGNTAATQTMLRGIRGEFDPYEFVPGKLIRQPRRKRPQQGKPGTPAPK